MNADTRPNFWAGLIQVDEASPPDGLDTVNAALLSLLDGVPVPQRAAEHLAQALRPCLGGDNDIAGRLGLRAPRRGGRHEAPAALAIKLRRDELIRAMIADMGLPMATSATALEMLWAYYWCQVPDPGKSAPAGKNIFGKPSKAPLLHELVRDHGAPLGYRQILRIANGEPAYTQRRKK